MTAAGASTGQGKRLVTFFLALVLAASLLTTFSCGSQTSTTVMAIATTTSSMAVQGWEVIVKNVSVETQFMTSDNTAYAPDAGSVFLVMDATFRRLPQANDLAFEIDEADIALVDGAGKTYRNVGDKRMYQGWQLGNQAVLTMFTADLTKVTEYELGLVYTVEESSIDQPITLRFAKAPDVSFSIANAPTTTDQIEGLETLTLDDASAALLESIPFVHSTEKFSIRAPRGWVVLENPEVPGGYTVHVTMASPRTDTVGTAAYAPLIEVISFDMANQNLAEFVEAYTAVNDFTVLESPRKVSVKGVPAYVISTESSGSGVVFKELQLITARAGTAYLARGLTSTFSWERDRPLFYASLLSFTLTP